MFPFASYLCTFDVMRRILFFSFNKFLMALCCCKLNLKVNISHISCCLLAASLHCDFECVLMHYTMKGTKQPPSIGKNRLHPRSASTTYSF